MGQAKQRAEEARRQRADAVAKMRAMIPPERLEDYDAWAANIEGQLEQLGTGPEALDAAYFTIVMGAAMTEALNARSEVDEEPERTVEIFKTMARVLGFEFARFLCDIVAPHAPFEEAAVTLANMMSVQFTVSMAQAIEQEKGKRRPDGVTLQ